MQAIILAAGMGRRLGDLTADNTKCMIEVNGVTLVERALRQLDELGLARIVLVVGYQKESLIEYVGSLGIATPIEYVSNDVYDKTNNIYSLYLAKDYLLSDDTLLLESDLIFEEGTLRDIVEHPYPTLALVAKYESWMDGTVVTLDEDDNIASFVPGKMFDFDKVDEYYKTVNIYKFDHEFSRTHYVPFLEAYCAALGNNEYYEQVLRVIATLDNPIIKGMRFEGRRWYEIDDIQDLDIAETLFIDTPEGRFDRLQARYGGFWRYPELKDFCYLVNPLFPTPRMIKEMEASFAHLLCEYPSGMQVNSLLAAKHFGVRPHHICVGNGAAELIKSLMTLIPGKVGIIYPTFEEYPHRLPADRIEAFVASAPLYRYTARDLMSFYEDKDIALLVVINPDNPSGNCLSPEEIMQLITWSDQRNIRLLVDESFADFAEIGATPMLFSEEILLAHPGLIVVKSISKSYGVPGLRLGVVATGDTDLIAACKKDVAIWNINSFGEYFMQIADKYEKDYRAALEKFREIRAQYIADLETISFLRVLPSQANYVTCEVCEPYDSRELALVLLEEHDILIKDLSSKKAFEKGSYIRLAVRDESDNESLVEAMRGLESPMKSQR